MFFGEKMRELRLENAKQGLHNFATTMNMSPLDYYNIESGYAPPMDSLWLHDLILKLNISFGSEDAVELTCFYNEPFVMQKMSTGGKISPLTHTTKGERLSPDKLQSLQEHLDDIVTDHNEKADEYNNGIQREDN